MAMSGLSRFGPLPLRLAIAAPLICHGYQKLFVNEFQEFITFVAGFGLPYSEVLAYTAAWGELAGGALLALGFVARLAALVNAGTMFVAVWKVHLAGDVMANWKSLTGDGGYEFPLLILAGCLALMCTGAGALSVDGALAMKKSKAEG